MVDAKKQDVVTPAMLKLFEKPDEPILFQAAVTKVSRFGFNQGRVLAVTLEHIYVFEAGKLSRRHRITNVAAIIRSTKSPQIVLHVPQYKDLRIDGLVPSDAKVMQDMIQLGYSHLDADHTLKIYAVDKESLKEYTNVDKKYAFVSLPDEKYRVTAEEIKGKLD